MVFSLPEIEKIPGTLFSTLAMSSTSSTVERALTKSNFISVRTFVATPGATGPAGTGAAGGCAGAAAAGAVVGLAAPAVGKTRTIEEKVAVTNGANAFVGMGGDVGCAGGGTTTRVANTGPLGAGLLGTLGAGDAAPAQAVRIDKEMIRNKRTGRFIICDSIKRIDLTNYSKQFILVPNAIQKNCATLI